MLLHVGHQSRVAVCLPMKHLEASALISFPLTWDAAFGSVRAKLTNSTGCRKPAWVRKKALCC